MQYEIVFKSASSPETGETGSLGFYRAGVRHQRSTYEAPGSCALASSGRGKVLPAQRCRARWSPGSRCAKVRSLTPNVQEARGQRGKAHQRLGSGGEKAQGGCRRGPAAAPSSERRRSGERPPRRAPGCLVRRGKHATVLQNGRAGQDGRHSSGRAERRREAYRGRLGGAPTAWRRCGRV